MARKQARYIVTVTFTADMTADEQLQSEQGIRDEMRSWLESLNAVVNRVTVRKAAA